MKKLNENTWSRYEDRKYEKLQIDPAEAGLKLALLKENFVYRKFHEELKKDPHSKIPELICINETFKTFKDRLDKVWKNDGPYFSDWLKKSSGMENIRIRRGFVFGAFYNRPDELIEFLDPSKDIQPSIYPPGEDPEEIATREDFFYERILPTLFYPQGITLLGGFSWEFPVLGSNASLTTEPYERLVKIDLSTRKAELLRQFEAFIDTMEKIRKYYKGSDRKKRGYDDWNSDSSRQTKEIQTQLEIWRMRKQRKGFSLIAKTMRISGDLAKKHFYRAFELTQQKPYDPDLYKRERVIKKSDLGKLCENCKDHPKNGGQCNTPCPDVMFYIDQDMVSQRERAFSEVGIKEDEEPFNPDEHAIEQDYTPARSTQSSDNIYGQHERPNSLLGKDHQNGPVRTILKKKK